MGFPKSVCISPNDILCHGIPNSRKFQEGDWVNFDVTCFYEGFFGDTSIMVKFGTVDEEICRMVGSTKKIDVGQKALYEAIKICKPGNSLADIARTIQQVSLTRSTVEAEGFDIDRHFTGHGIGQFLHQFPHVQHNCSSWLIRLQRNSRHQADPWNGFYHRANRYHGVYCRHARYRPRQIFYRFSRQSILPVGTYRSNHRLWL